MELSEKERLMLVEKKEEIRKLTMEILDIKNNPKQALELKKKMASILSFISTIASYSESKNYRLNAFTEMAQATFSQMREPSDKMSELYPKIWSTLIMPKIELFCIYVNSIRFEFTRKDFKIHIPKIDISIFRTDK